MKKILYSLLIFVSVFFVIDKVSALTNISSYNNSSSNKVNLGSLMHGYGLVELYGVNNSGDTCGTYSSPDSNANIDCFYNGILSLAKDSTPSNSTNSAIAFRFYNKETLLTDTTYNITIDIIASSTSSASNLINHLVVRSVTNAKLITNSITCDGLNCKLNLIITMTSDTSELYIDFDTTWNLVSLNSAMSYLFMPQVEETSLSAIFGFKDVSPSVTMVETAEQIAEDVNYTINNTSPSLSYGSATYNYIFNQFIPNELYSEYGEYYVCGGSGTAYASYCYISDSPDVFTIRYSYSGSPTSPIFTYFSVYVKPTSEHKVYEYVISSGSKGSSSAYITSSTFVSELYGDFNTSIYMPTNVSYFKMGDTTYNTIKTADGYMFNPGDIILYQNGTEFVVNTDYKTPDNLTEEPYVAKSSLEFDKQVHNFDIYVDKSDNLSDLSYKLNYVDHNDYTNTDMTKAKLYGVMFYGLKNENGLYHWEQLDDCTNWDFPSEYCHVKSKYEQLEHELGKDGYTIEGYVDFLSIFDEYDTIRIVVRLDNAFAGKIDYWDKNLEISALDVDVNYFGFDYSRNLNDSDLNRYVIFTTKEQEITDNMFIVSSSDEIFIDYFDTKEGNFREYTAMDPRKNYDNTYIFTYNKIGLNNNLGFYVLTDKNRTERLVYNFYIKPHLYFSYNNSDVLEDTIYIDNTGNITNSNIAITPDELVDYEYNDINDLFENIKKFNDSINVISNEIHSVIQYAYDSLNIYIKSFLISIFTIILVSATIILIRR